MANSELTALPKRATGRPFAVGNAAGSQRLPPKKRAAKLRAAALRAVTPSDMRAAIKAMIEAAKAGDVQATKLILNLLDGKGWDDPPEQPQQRQADQPLEPLDVHAMLSRGMSLETVKNLILARIAQIRTYADDE